VSQLYQEYFYVPKEGRITEKVMMARVVSMVVVVILCLLGMSLTAYAYFSHSETSSGSSITAAEFNVAVSLSEEGTALAETTPATPPATLSPDEEGYYTLQAGKSYSVEFSLLIRPKTAGTGFVKILFTSENGKTVVYHTLQLYKDSAKGPQEFSFPLSISSNGGAVKAKFISHWGTSSKYDYDVSDSATNYIKDSTVPITPDFTNVLAMNPGLGEIGELVYVVQEADNLTSIAAQYEGVTWLAIAERNNIEPPDYVIHVGQQLIIPAPSP